MFQQNTFRLNGYFNYLFHMYVKQLFQLGMVSMPNAFYSTMTIYLGYWINLNMFEVTIVYI